MLLLTYKQLPYVVSAFRSCLSQEGVVLEIIASDDASNDGTYEALLAEAESYSGPHRVIVRCNEQNMGLVPHLNLLMSLASGDRIVVAAGDDVSYPYRVARLMECFDSSEDVYAVYSNAICVNEDGSELGKLYGADESLRDIGWQRMAQSGTAGVTGCGLAWKRANFVFFGPLDRALKAEDQAIPFRAALLGKVVYISEPLLQYRWTHNSLSLWRMYRNAFIRFSLRDMRMINKKMIDKNHSDLCSMRTDLLKIDSMPSTQDALYSLRQRIERLEVEGGLLSGKGVGWLLSTNVFASSKMPEKVKLLFVAMFSNVYLVLKGIIIVVSHMSITTATDSK